MIEEIKKFVEEQSLRIFDLSIMSENFVFPRSNMKQRPEFCIFHEVACEILQLKQNF